MPYLSKTLPLLLGPLLLSACGPQKPTAHTHSMPGERVHHSNGMVRTYASSEFNQPGNGELDKEGQEAPTATAATAINGTGYGPLRPNRTQIEPHGEGR